MRKICLCCLGNLLLLPSNFQIINSLPNHQLSKECHVIERSKFGRAFSYCVSRKSGIVANQRSNGFVHCG